MGVLPIRKCLVCNSLFNPTRSDHVFDTRSCERRYRRYNDGPLPTEKNLANTWPAYDRQLYVRAIRSAKPPRTAIGYMLYSNELQIWLPLARSLRYDGRRPQHTYFELRPVELPRVPLPSNYRIAWVFHGGVVVPTDPPYLVWINLVSDMQRTDEIGRRLRYWRGLQAQQKAAEMPPAAPQPTLNQGPEGDDDDDDDDDDE